MYYFYSSKDKNREPIAKVYHIDTEFEAIMYFASLKQMGVNEFLSIYTVVRL